MQGITSYPPDPLSTEKMWKGGDSIFKGWRAKGRPAFPFLSRGKHMATRPSESGGFLVTVANEITMAILNHADRLGAGGGRTRVRPYGSGAELLADAALAAGRGRYASRRGVGS